MSGFCIFLPSSQCWILQEKLMQVRGTLCWLGSGRTDEKVLENYSRNIASLSLCSNCAPWNTVRGDENSNWSMANDGGMIKRCSALSDRGWNELTGGRDKDEPLGRRNKRVEMKSYFAGSSVASLMLRHTCTGQCFKVVEWILASCRINGEKDFRKS